jgi:hypothetical protein
MKLSDLGDSWIVANVANDYNNLSRNELRTMKPLRMKVIVQAILLSILIVVSSHAASGNNGQFQMYFDSGGNILDTFHGTFTKNMYVDPPLTINVRLTKNELKRIHEKMDEIGFFNFPDKLECSASSSPSDSKQFACDLSMQPATKYIFKVQTSSGIKQVTWSNGSYSTMDERVVKLQELIQLVLSILYSKKEIKSMPHPRVMPL